MHVTRIIRRTSMAFAAAAAFVITAFTWSPSASAQVTSTYTNATSGMCMGVSGGNMTNGTAVIQWPCIANDQDQLWIHAYSGPSLWKNAKDQTKCLAIAANSKNLGDGQHYLGAGLIIWDCQPTNPGQLWGLSANNAGVLQLWSQLTGPNSAAGVLIYTREGSQLDNEVWYNYAWSPQLWEGAL